jgi:hypothetical protein
VSNSNPAETPRLSKPLHWIRELLSQKEEVIVATTGQSMWPTIRDGDEVVIAAMERKPKRGEIILFEDRDRAVLHRVVRVSGEIVQTRGDAAGQPDAEIRLAAIVGLAVARIGTAGRAPLEGAFGVARSRLRHRVRPLRETLARLLRKS